MRIQIMLNGCIQIAKELSKYTAKMRKNGQFLVGGNIVGNVSEGGTGKNWSPVTPLDFRAGPIFYAIFSNIW